MNEIDLELRERQELLDRANELLKWASHNLHAFSAHSAEATKINELTTLLDKRAELNNKLSPKHETDELSYC